MSLDARYILSYDSHRYVEPTPLQIDYEFLKNKFGGELLIFNNGDSIYWDKPKYTLPLEDIDLIRADQILERRDGELWKIIKG